MTRVGLIENKMREIRLVQTYQSQDKIRVVRGDIVRVDGSIKASNDAFDRARKQIHETNANWNLKLHLVHMNVRCQQAL